jgi:uncharacterized protein (DUF952 family)
MSPPTPDLVFKIAEAGAFAEAQDEGVFAGAPIDLKDGFIHFSTAGQVAETLKLHFKGRHDLVLAAVRTADLGDALRWEPSRGGALFPHLYGNLLMAAVDWVEGVEVDDDGNCTLPDRIG